MRCPAKTPQIHPRIVRYRCSRIQGTGIRSFASVRLGFFNDDRLQTLRAAVTSVNLLPFWRVYIDLVQVTTDMGKGEQSLVHDSIPEPGYIGDQVGTEITVRQSRQIIEMSQ